MLGTHSEADLRRLLASGLYHPTDFYWKPGMAAWAPLSSLTAHAAGAAATPSASQPGQRLAIRGTVISFNIQNGTGLISGLNGVRYNFVTANWGSPTVAPSIGLLVEFEASGPDAVHIFASNGHSGVTGSGDFYRSSDNVIVAGVCAGLAHKWNSDPVLIRIAMVFVPFGWIFYIIGSMSWSARPTRGMNP
jgi:phage shock protein PspC (stress-responsive transcriptional regulator)